MRHATPSALKWPYADGKALVHRIDRICRISLDDAKAARGAGLGALVEFEPRYESGLAHQQQRAVGMAQHVLRGAAEQQPAQPAATVRGHGDQVGAIGLGPAQDGVGDRALDLLVLDRQAVRAQRPGQTFEIILGLLVFGLAHFVYDDFSATMIPRWMPAPPFWVYLTGCGHLAAGLSLISGVATRLATTLLSAMFACFVLLLHLPRVVSDPGSRVEWIMLGVSTSLTGAAWIVRTICGARASMPLWQTRSHEQDTPA